MIQLRPDMSTPIDPRHKWCTYISRHPKGFYYIGKGLTKSVLAGTYKGSGTSLVAAWEFGGLPKNEWTAEVTATFPEEPLQQIKNQWKDPGELKAYAHEKELITFEMLCDPFCLNDVPGGKGGFKWGKVSKRALNKRKKAVKMVMARPEVKQRHSAIKKALSTPEATRHLMSVKQSSHPKLECAHCGGLFRPAALARWHGDRCKMNESAKISR